jgi:hypothetical protein
VQHWCDMKWQRVKKCLICSYFLNFSEPQSADKRSAYWAANADVLAKRKDVIERFMKAYRESIDYMYSSTPQVVNRLCRIRQGAEAVGQARAG